jgi:hypothetical protein
MNKGKKGQVTLFIILGIIVFSGIFAFVFWIQPTYLTTSSTKLNFDSCIESVISDGVEQLAITGGFKNPSFSVIYKGQEIPYFVYTSGYLGLNDDSGHGVVQVPFPTEQFEEELYSYTIDLIKDCYDSSVKKLQKEGYNVTSGDADAQISILPNTVKVLIDAPTLIESKQYEEIIVNVPSEIYGILQMASKIMEEEVQSDSEFDLDVVNLMQMYPNYIVQVFRKSDSTKIFVIQDRTYGTKYQFASRSNIVPTLSNLNEYYVTE